jgi:hypothetical protein
MTTIKRIVTAAPLEKSGKRGFAAVQKMHFLTSS